MIPLVIRSHYSMMWGATPIKALCRAARERGYDRLALTDTDNLCGLWTFLQTCRLEGLTPIVGAEVTDSASTGRAFCLVENQAGYRNLCRLLTRRHGDENFDLAATLPEYAPGLLVLTADPDLLTAWRTAVDRLAAALPRRPGPASIRAYQAARRLDLPAAAVPASFFLDPDEWEVHRTLRAIALNTSLSRLSPPDLAGPDAWLAPAEEYQRRFALWPEVVSNTLRLAESLTFTGPDSATVMPPWSGRAGESAAQALRRQAYAGARALYGRDLSEDVVGRLEHELALIEAKNFSSYFLVVRDIIRRSPRICGRGSGAASLTAYCLRITNVCPLKHNLYFERFINADRRDPPDIDVDFAWDERDGVINSVLDEYGERAAMVSSHILFQPRLAIRETAKVFGLPTGEIGELSRRLPWFWRSHEFRTDLKSKLYERPETRSLELAEPWPEIIRLAGRIVGAPRHLSVHPGGVVITPDPVADRVPVQTSAKGVPIIQWEKDGAEDAGLVKIDLLGNRSLGVIRDAVADLKENGVPFDEADWEPEDDAATEKAVAQGRTMGCFYIESPATRLLQQKTGVGDFEHLVIHSSIIRPAANDFIQEYIRRLRGGEWEPIHPLLTDILDETYGIMVYQEDVSKTAVALAGLSHADADGLRKVMSKKDKAHILDDYRKRFFEGARSKGVAPERIQAVWDMMMSFSGYSFCKPHSASYARVSFQAAYLKVHHPAEFMAAVISNQGGFYSAFAYVSEARRLSLEVLPPSVNQSRVHWRGREKTLRAGLMAVAGLSRETRGRIVDQRRNGLFFDVDDFHQRVRPDEDEFCALSWAGALDDLAGADSRAALAWEMARLRKKAAGAGAPAGLFAAELAPPPPPLSPDREIERLRRQFAVLGFLPDRHPIELFADRLDSFNLVKAADLPRHVGRRVSLAGWLLTGKLVKTKHGDPMQFLTFEDETSLFETTFFPRAYDRFCQVLEWGRPFILSGLVEENYGAHTLTVDRVRRVP